MLSCNISIQFGAKIALKKFHVKTNLYFFQVRDEYRTDYDAGRGGYGQIMKTKLDMTDIFAAWKKKLANNFLIHRKWNVSKKLCELEYLSRIFYKYLLNSELLTRTTVVSDL